MSSYITTTLYISRNNLHVVIQLCQW